MNEARTRRFMPYPELAAKVASASPKAIDEVAFPIMAEGVADIVRAGGYAAITASRPGSARTGSCGPMRAGSSPRRL